MTNRTILVVGLILIIALATNRIIDVAEREPQNQTMARNDPDQYLVNADLIQFNAQGEKAHELTAKRMTHFPLTDVTTLQSPNLTLYSEHETAPWDIVGKNGRLLPKSPLQDESVELWDNVVAKRTRPNGSFINIKSQSLTVFPKKNIAETTDKVFIENNSGQTSAGAMKAYLDPGRFEFFSAKGQRVNTVLWPKSLNESG